MLRESFCNEEIYQRSIFKDCYLSVTMIVFKSNTYTSYTYCPTEAETYGYDAHLYIIIEVF